jgi:hypothetical protein
MLVKLTPGKFVSWKNSWTYTWYIVVVAGAVREQAVPDLPGEDGWTLALVLGDPADYAGCRDTRLWTPDRSGFNGAGLVIPGEKIKSSLQVCE